MPKNWPLAAFRKQPWPLPPAIATQLDRKAAIEEEQSADYHPDRFYPARIGETLNGRYQLATKLGHGAQSTVWLARDLNRWRWSSENYVAVKLSASTRSTRRQEINMLKHISLVDPTHKGWHFVRKLQDAFTIKGPGGEHSCLVLEALREPLWLYRRRYLGQVVPVGILKVLVQMILHALDYLHSSCQVIHTDLKPDNVMIQAEDPGVFQRDATDEFLHPLPQKIASDGRIIYLARNNYGPLARPTGIIQLVDFDLAVRTERGKIHHGAIQGESYRAPEVILAAGYTSSADTWALGVMLWDLLEGQQLFSPEDPERPGEYDETAHLSQVTALLGPPPSDLLDQGLRTMRFFHNYTPRIIGHVPAGFTLNRSITRISGDEKDHFLRFVSRMLTWRPSERSTAKELLGDPWLHEDFSQE